MASPESSITHHIENKNFPDRKEIGDKGFDAEDAVVDFFRQLYPNMEVRHATSEEDRGFTGFDSGKTIDAVVYTNEGFSKPSLGLQITTATDSVVRMKKMTELKSRPFLRLDEMKSTDPSIPRVLVFVEAKEVDKYSQDPNFNHHEKLSTQIIESIINSLKFDLLQTKNLKEQIFLKQMIVTWESELKNLKTNKSGKPI